jgi:imidazolonepropionase
MTDGFKLADLPSADGVWHPLHLAPEALGAGLPAVPDAAIVVAQGLIAWVGAHADLPDAYLQLPRHDGRGALVTPGLVDCHTHLVYGGQRANEFAMRLAGASYEEVARAGGGIVSSVKATREASEEELFDAAVPRLQALLAEGVCAIEIKSGCGPTAGPGLWRHGAHHVFGRARVAA